MVQHRTGNSIGITAMVRIFVTEQLIHSIVKEIYTLYVTRHTFSRPLEIILKTLDGTTKQEICMLVQIDYVELVFLILHSNFKYIVFD